ncbi:MAG: hypothetical protein KGL93_02040 [Gemmatimonadota bacterium]|nr:hypothetical protein [Gemmatimonadota bacterium]HEU4989697.1 hypothetical protein [Gemmatimonadaceae bacterium]
MSTKLTHEIRREITIDGEPFTVIISPHGLRLSRKRFRSGRELTWEALWREGGAEMANGSRPTGSPVPGGAASV